MLMLVKEINLRRLKDKSNDLLFQVLVDETSVLVLLVPSEMKRKIMVTNAILLIILSAINRQAVVKVLVSIRLTYKLKQTQLI